MEVRVYLLQAKVARGGGGGGGASGVPCAEPLGPGPSNSLALSIHETTHIHLELQKVDPRGL